MSLLCNMLFFEKPLSCVQHFVTPWTVAHQAPPSINFLGMSTGVGCHFLLQGIFPTQGLKLGLLHYRWILYHLSHQGSPIEMTDQFYFWANTSFEEHLGHSKKLRFEMFYRYSLKLSEKHWQPWAMVANNMPGCFSLKTSKLIFTLKFLGFLERKKDSYPILLLGIKLPIDFGGICFCCCY